MKKLVLICAGVTALAFGRPSVAADTVIKIACYLPPRSVTVSKVLMPFIKEVEAATKGSIKFQTYWGGALGRNPEKQYELVTNGIADIAYMATYLSHGQFPDSTIFDLPGVLPDATVGSVAYWRMYKAGMLRGFDDIKVVSLYMTGMNGVHTRKPFKTLEDLKGMKIRASGPLIADFLKQLGVVPVFMSNNDMPQALATGVVDGLTNEWVGIATFKLQNLLRYHFEAPIGTTSFVIAMNKQKWNSLDARQKAAIDKFGEEYMAKRAGMAYDEATYTRRNKFKDDGRVLIYPSKQEWARDMRKYGEPMYKEWIKQRPDGQKKFDTLKKILAEVESKK